MAYGTGSNAPKSENVAIGDNTFARTGSTMIGSHNYKGDLGDTTVDTATTRTDALNAYATTVGANSFTNGAFATNTGTYNIISSGYTGGCSSNPSKNLGATINGSLNSIESKTANSYYSGVANSIVGTANRTFNSNGSIIMGAGNKITNSVKSIDGVRDDGGNSAKELAGKFREAVKESNGGGATMAFGGGNAAALGAFYRPNEDMQLSVGSTVGNGETVVNAGFSVKVGAHSNVSRSRVAIGKEVLELKKTVAFQNAQIQKLITLLNGAQVNEQLVTEFSPEMALFRVDTVAKNHQGQPIVERVRANKNNI